jgi:predicted 3-demethylubiquinone-9 3-methyltransferase (glyoxalase superfamily)
MQKIRPFLAFDNQAEEAANFYVSIFKNSKVENVSHYGDAGPAGPAGSVLAVNFKLEDQDFIALNCGPVFKFSPAISLLIDCSTQEEVDELWAKLSAVPEAEGCGWLRDKFGVTWQVTPTVLGEMMQDKDPKKASSVSQALMQMKKIDIKTLRDAYDQA